MNRKSDKDFQSKRNTPFNCNFVPRRGFEPPTNSLGNCCSILLSYRGSLMFGSPKLSYFVQISNYLTINLQKNQLKNCLAYPLNLS